MSESKTFIEHALRVDDIFEQKPVTPTRMLDYCRSVLGAKTTWRRSFAWVGGRHPAEAWLVPPPPSTIPEYIQDLCRFVDSDSLPLDSKAILFSFQWLHIHPLADGNGRISRCLAIALAKAHGDLWTGIALGFLIANKPDLMKAEWDDLRNGRIDKATAILQRTKLAMEKICQTGGLISDAKRICEHISRIFYFCATPDIRFLQNAFLATSEVLPACFGKLSEMRRKKIIHQLTDEAGLIYADGKMTSLEIQGGKKNAALLLRRELFHIEE